MANKTGMKLKGLDNALKTLNRKIKATGVATIAGAYAAGLEVQGAAQRRVPVEYGNLRGSAYTQKSPDGNSVQVGFSAAYALYVHENQEQVLEGQPRPSGLGDYWGPNGEPQFLTKSLQEKEKRILELMAHHGKKGLKQ